MNERIHAYLDGDRSRPTFSAEEERELAAIEQATSAVTGCVRRAHVPDFVDLVMSVLPEPHGEPSPSNRLLATLHAAGRWLWTPWQIPLRPAHALCGGLAVALALLAAPSARDAGSPGAAVAGAGSSEATPVYVQFRLDAPGASHVSLTGSFTDWQPAYELREATPGVWVALVALPPGVHDYLFVVNGEEWVADPVARPVEDGFGGTNSRLFLAPPTNRI
jgi:hypothetical protein